MAENLLEAPAPAGTRPPHIPEKFWDPEAGALRVEALLKSYLELERKLSAGPQAPHSPSLVEDREALLRALGVPEAPDGYQIRVDHGLFDTDPEINARLHTAGFTPEQAQLLYDLAAERLTPMLQDLAAEFQAERELERLKEHFGGDDRWREVSRQILAWGRKNLPGPAVDGLCTTCDGVLAMYRMMTGAEPSALKGGDLPAGTGEAELRQMMRDPRYWRDRDPAFVTRVTEGFRKLYPDGD